MHANRTLSRGVRGVQPCVKNRAVLEREEREEGFDLEIVLFARTIDVETFGRSKFTQEGLENGKPEGTRTFSTFSAIFLGDSRMFRLTATCLSVTRNCCRVETIETST